VAEELLYELQGVSLHCDWVQLGSLQVGSMQSAVQSSEQVSLQSSRQWSAQSERQSSMQGS